MSLSKGPLSEDERCERASIKLDIAIDEQDQESFKKIVQLPNDDLVKDILRLNTPGDRNTFWKLLLDDEGRITIQAEVLNQGPPSPFWSALFLAKRLRAELQSENCDDQTKKLDWLVDLLVTKAAALIPSNETFQYLILMIELSACTVGEQSLGFSEKAKGIVDIIEAPSFPKWKPHAYKSLIHYNQGIAKFHMHFLSDALKEFNEAIKEYKEAKEDGCDPIWSTYVYYPSVLQKAEVLIKMQFSYNALNTLIKIEDQSNPLPFQMARRNLLQAACYIELDDWDSFYQHFKHDVNECEKGGVKYFQRKALVAGEGNFLKARKAQDKDKVARPWLLTSSYNSLVLDAKKHELKERISDYLCAKNKQPKSVPFDELDLIEFIRQYLAMCHENKFDRLTIKETILDFLEALAPLIEEELKDREPLSSLPKSMSIANELIGLLNDGPNFIKDEISVLELDSVRKTVRVFEDINETVLEYWFKAKCKTKPISPPRGNLPEEYRIPFDFERGLLSQLQDGYRLDYVRRKFDKRSVNVRKKLLDHILGDDGQYHFSNLQSLRDSVVCISHDEESCENARTATCETASDCLQHVIDSIRSGGHNTKGILEFADYDEILKVESQRFDKHKTDRSMQPLPRNLSGNTNNDALFFNYVGLRRWNSYTPALSFSVGGGHFVFVSKLQENGLDRSPVHMGVAVDPGFDFIRNFFRQGFTLTDIDIVLLTHGHPDHIRDFPAIVELLNENRARNRPRKKDKPLIYAIMSLGCYKRLEDHIARPPFKELFYDTIIVDPDEGFDSGPEPPFRFIWDEKNRRGVKLIPPDHECENSKEPVLEVKSFKALHDDHSQSDSYGYILTLRAPENCGKVSIGFTGDSKWFPEYAKDFTECDLICSHIGSIAEPKPGKFLKDYDFVGKAERLMRKKNHPYLFGEILFLQDWKNLMWKAGKKALILISEFGEEMKGQIRSDLAKRLNVPRKGSGCWSDLGGGMLSKCGVFPHFISAICKKDCGRLDDCKKGAENIYTIPVDVGLRISMPLGRNSGAVSENDLPGRVHCVICEEFVDPDKIDYEVYSHEEAIFYVCGTCLRSKSVDVRHSVYQKYHEKGREIEKFVPKRHNSERDRRLQLN